MTNEQFVKTWNRSNDLNEVVAKTNQSKHVVAVKASRLRKQGFMLKMMPFHSVRPLVDRFWPKVRRTENCWLWMASKNKKGYGQISTKRNEKPLQSHRVSWELHFGRIPDGLMVLHKCDNPGCVNPSHLFLGSASDNTHDMMNKNRGHWQGNAPSKAS